MDEQKTHRNLIVMKSSIRNFPLSFLLILILNCQIFAQTGHDFLHEQYDLLHDSPAQQKFRKIAPVPAGVVYIQHPGEGEAEIREHFRNMKELGFTNLKQIMSTPDWTLEQIQLIALEEGLIPWWYGEGGWEPITDALIRKLGIPAKTSMYEVRRHPTMIAYQMEVLRKRVEHIIAYKDSTGESALRGGNKAYDPSVGQRGMHLSDKGKELFVQWAKATYVDIDSLNVAYNQHHHGQQALGGAFTSWDDFAKRWENHNHREYRIRRDVLRFKADHGLKELRKKVETFRAFDPNMPFRAGGELSLFRPHAWWSVDFAGIADVMQDAGSFYPSIHFSWHFDEVDNELGPTLYMQSSYINDMFKGGWSGGWETTGGPQQFDGEKFGHPDKGFTVDAGQMTQFTLSMLASGFKGWGLWCWSVRSAGKEAGEYALLDHHNEVTDRAIAVGKIAQGMQRYREELWAAHKEPLVGVFFDWDNEGIYAAMSHRGRESFRDRPMEARVGASRALINGNIPFEYLIPDDLKAGLAARYPVIYLPGIIAMRKELLPILTEYVEQGGRLVLDMPGGWYDTYATLLPRGRGSAFASLFGSVLREYQYAGINRPMSLHQQKLLGSIGVIRPEGAEVIATFENGKPAVTEYQLGKGSAVIIGYEAARACFKPGNEAFEDLLRKYVLGSYVSPYRCEGAIAYRLASQEADHYFLINDGPSTQVQLEFMHVDYKEARDVTTNEAIGLYSWIKLDAYSGRWLRFEK